MLLDLLFLTQGVQTTSTVAGDEHGAPAVEVGTITARASLQGEERGVPADTTDTMTVRVALSGAERGAPADTADVLTVRVSLAGSERGAPAGEAGSFSALRIFGGTERGAPALDNSTLGVIIYRTLFGVEQAAGAQESSVYTALNSFLGFEQGASARESFFSTVVVRFTGTDLGAPAVENMTGKGDLASTISRAEYEALETCVRAETGYITIFAPSLVPSTVVARLVRLGFIELKEGRTARPEVSRWGYGATPSGKAIYLEIKHRREALGDQGYNYFGVP